MEGKPQVEFINTDCEELETYNKSVEVDKKSYLNISNMRNGLTQICNSIMTVFQGKIIPKDISFGFAIYLYEVIDHELTEFLKKYTEITAVKNKNDSLKLKDNSNLKQALKFWNRSLSLHLTSMINRMVISHNFAGDDTEDLGDNDLIKAFIFETMPAVHSKINQVFKSMDDIGKDLSEPSDNFITIENYINLKYDDRLLLPLTKLEEDKSIKNDPLKKIVNNRLVVSLELDKGYEPLYTISIYE